MHLCYWSIVSAVLIVISLAKNQTQNNKVKVVKVKVLGGSSGLSGPIKIQVLKTLERRKKIIKCCGFKKCLPTATNATTKRTASSSIMSKESQYSRTSSSEAQNAAIATGSTPDGQKSQKYDGPAVIGTMTSAGNGNNNPTADYVDSSPGGGLGPRTMSDVANNDQGAGNSQPAAGTSDTNFNPTTNDVSGATADGADTIATFSDTPMSPSSITSTVPPDANTVTIIVKTTTRPPTTASPTTTTTTTTTTTAAPCQLTCSDFNKYLLNPTVEPSPSDGSVLTATLCNKKQYYVSNVEATRNEAALRCKSMNMTLLTVASFEEMDCLAVVKVGTFWTSGSNEDLNCDSEKKYAWCSTGFNVSTTLISSVNYWLPTTAAPSALERCLAVVTSNTAQNMGMVHRKCDDTLNYVCQFAVDCPKICTKNDSLFDSSGKLINEKSYGFWIDIGNYTYLLGNKPMTWLDSYLHCCALGMEALNLDNLAEQNGLTNMTVVFKGKWKMNFNYWTSGTWKGAPVGQWAWCEPTGPTVLAPNLKWEANQPDNFKGNESCVHFRFVLNATGTIMTDRTCESRYIFACKTPLRTTPKPCVVSCPTGLCERNKTYFDKSTGYLKDYFGYGDWYDACGRNFLVYKSNLSNWQTAWQQCCDIGLTLASMESKGKSDCFSKIASKYAPETFGDFWLSGTDLGCPSNFRWCLLNRDFVEPEIKWKDGHPKPDLDCVYLEVRNGSELLATADCGEKKNFLCEIRKRGTSQRAMQTECADIWNITIADIDLLLNTAMFLTANVSLNLKCFLKCVGVEVGLFDLGALKNIEMLRQLENVTMEDPVKMQQGFVAYDECSDKKYDDECVTAYETYKCGQQKAPDLVSKLVTQNFDNGSVYAPPTPCINKRRTCWMSANIPCEINQTLSALFKDETYTDKYGGRAKSYNAKLYYISKGDTATQTNAADAYRHCCELGLVLLEPITAAEIEIIHTLSMNSLSYVIAGETEAINQTHEVYCRSRKVIPDILYDPTFTRHPCLESVVGYDTRGSKIIVRSHQTNNIHDMYFNRNKYAIPANAFDGYICVRP